MPNIAITLEASYSECSNNIFNRTYSITMIGNYIKSNVIDRVYNSVLTERFGSIAYNCCVSMEKCYLLNFLSNDLGTLFDCFGTIISTTCYRNHAIQGNSFIQGAEICTNTIVDYYNSQTEILRGKL